MPIVNHIIIYRDECISDEVFDSYVELDFGKYSEDGNSIIFYCINEELAKELNNE